MARAFIIGIGDLGHRFYREALGLEPLDTDVWYFINNNLGFSLNALGQFQEGEQFCRAAININGQRPNAFKNLGIALQAQGKFGDAAQCFIKATQVNASDPRSAKLLQELIEHHPEVGLTTELEYCQRAVATAYERCRAEQPTVHHGFHKQLILFRGRLITWWRRWWLRR